MIIIMQVYIMSETILDMPFMFAKNINWPLSFLISHIFMTLILGTASTVPRPLAPASPEPLEPAAVPPTDLRSFDRQPKQTKTFYIRNRALVNAVKICNC